MRRSVFRAAVIAAALWTCTVASAQTPEFAQIDTDSTLVAVNAPMHPLYPCSITQSLDPNTLVDGTSVACVGAVTTENSWLRKFDLDGDHGLVGYFDVESVDWGIQSVVGALDLTVNVYCLDSSLPFLYQFMVLMDSVVVPLADETLTFHNTAIGGACDPATQDLVIDLHAEDCNVAGCQHCFIGMNDLGATGPTYIASSSCGIDEPLDLQAIGFVQADLVMVVNGQGGCGGDDDGGCSDDGGDVPATTGTGAMLLLFVLLGTGAYFLRRRARG